jgi:RNA polymerase sigma factor (sigma-70 family)
LLIEKIVLLVIEGRGQGSLEQLEVKELMWDFRRALAKMIPIEAEVFCLRYIINMSYREIAKLTEISVVVGVRLHRAKRILRELLKKSPGNNLGWINNENG